MRWSATVLVLTLATDVVPAAAPAAECAAPKAVVTTAVGMKYCADPAFDAVIATQAQRARQDARAQRRAGKLIVYASTPISPRGGGHVETNLEIAASVKRRLEKAYGGAVWVLDPGRYQMPDVGSKSPGGTDYMVMWTAVLAGEDSMGRDFDMVHFTGPNDMRAFFGCLRVDVTGCIDRWLSARAGGDEKLRAGIAADSARRQAFVRYHALRASSAYSSGAHDEWSIFVRINRKRPLGEQVAVFFDGRPASPPETEVMAESHWESHRTRDLPRASPVPSARPKPRVGAPM
ncbi:MAG: hypothetical protein Q7W02_25620 [Candidatus Rokubacteria bacterium]|nr:hypothetical protein [Candidatus Rokubacteria bacterium]